MVRGSFRLFDWRPVAGIGLLIATTTGGLFCFLASPAWAANCGLFAGTPTKPHYNSIYAEGGRSGCASRIDIQTYLEWNRPFSPDPTLDYKSGTYSNVTFGLTSDCLVGTHEYYVETYDGFGEYATSDPRRSFTCPA